MNKCIFKGRLTSDPELKQTQNSISVCKFSVAVNRSYKEQDGSYKADFIRCTAWKGTADFISKYFNKGQEIIVEGEMRNADYTDKDGVKHYAMDLNVNSAEFCGSKSDNAGTTQNNATAQIGNIGDFEEILSGGDIPF